MGELGSPWSNEDLDELLDVEIEPDALAARLGNELSRSQYETWFDVKFRWETYKHVPREDYVDPIKDPIDKLYSYGFNRYHSVLDVACGLGEALVDLRLLYEHKGPLIGVDISPNIFMPSQTLLEHEEVEPVTFLLGDMQDLNSLQIARQDPGAPQYAEVDFIKRQPDFTIADESIDLVKCDFALYHADDVEAAIAQMLAKLNNGGLFEVATSGLQNKRTQRIQEKALAKFFGSQGSPTQPPPRFNAAFNRSNAPRVFARFPELELLGMIKQETHAVIDNTARGEDVRRANLLSLNSMRKAFSPIPPTELWLLGLDKVVNEPIDRALSHNGVIYIPVQRYWWFFRKNSNSAN